MQVYLLRHGIAEGKSAKGGDAARELTAEGRAELKHVLKAAAKAGVKPALILTSPYVRARGTDPGRRDPDTRCARRGPPVADRGAPRQRRQMLSRPARWFQKGSRKWFGRK